MTAWIRVKIAVVPPIPKASVSMAATVKTGDSRNCRIHITKIAEEFLHGRPLPSSGEYVETRQRVPKFSLLRCLVGWDEMPVKSFNMDTET